MKIMKFTKEDRIFNFKNLLLLLMLINVFDFAQAAPTAPAVRFFASAGGSYPTGGFWIELSSPLEACKAWALYEDPTGQTFRDARVGTWMYSSGYMKAGQFSCFYTVYYDGQDHPNDERWPAAASCGNYSADAPIYYAFDTALPVEGSVCVCVSGECAVPVCTPPKILDADSNTCVLRPTANPKSIPDTSSCNTKEGPQATDNSISVVAGNEVLRDTDYSGLGFATPTFNRTYNSTPIVATDNQGQQWRNGLNRSIKIINGFAVSYRAGGKIFTFSLNSGSWLPDADITDKLIELKDPSYTRIGWTHTVDATGEVETYDATGKLLSISTRSGLTQTMAYSCSSINPNCPVATPLSIAPIPGLLITITDSEGRTLHFTYDSLNRIKTMTNPAGGLYTYTYSTDNNNNLTSVTYPDGSIKTYLYGEAANVSATPEPGGVNANLLTGIVDEKGNRYATYRYDSKGRAYDEEHAPELSASQGQAIDHNNLVYNVDGSGNPTTTSVTDSRGAVRTYNFTTILGVVKSTGQSQPAGSGCAASAAALTYDANGNVSSRTDFNGNKTTYVYDMSRNLETSRTEGLTTSGTATAATRTITTTWHPTWRLPLTISEYTGATATGTPVKTTTTVYDSKGNIISYTEADPVRNISRSTATTYTYSTAVPGLVLTKVVDGPRTDVNDVTTYIYYPHDATCAASTAAPIVDPITGTSPANLGCRGQLQNIQNPLGQTITYDRYNHHGQVEQMTDANGLVTSYTYDLRQRLLTKTVGTEVTSLTYDPVGQVTQLTLPDGSALNYTYDAAHRLTEVQDSLGNKVTYSLDTEGNRITEETKDPQGNLTKTLARSYDVLNRLQQVNGVE